MTLNKVAFVAAFLLCGGAVLAEPPAHRLPDPMMPRAATQPAASAKFTIKIEPGRASFSAGEDVIFSITITNMTPSDVDAPATYWAARLILDGKEYKRLPEFSEAWNGAGVILAKKDFRSTLSLFEYGIHPPIITAGKHKISVKIGEDTSNELLLTLKPFVLNGAQAPAPSSPPATQK